LSALNVPRNKPADGQSHDRLDREPVCRARFYLFNSTISPRSAPSPGLNTSQQAAIGAACKTSM